MALERIDQTRKIIYVVYCETEGGDQLIGEYATEREARAAAEQHQIDTNNTHEVDIRKITSTRTVSRFVDLG